MIARFVIDSNFHQNLNAYFGEYQTICFPKDENRFIDVYAKMDEGDYIDFSKHFGLNDINVALFKDESEEWPLSEANKDGIGKYYYCVSRKH
jgi:hypothetical protein